MTKRNPGASVRARLLNKARAQGVDFQLLLTRYGLERLLYRLEQVYLVLLLIKYKQRYLMLLVRNSLGLLP